MKTLSQYVNDNYLYEGLSESDIQLLNEGIGSAFGKLFGWASGKTQNMVNDFKDSYATTLANTLAGKKSKNKQVQKDSAELQDKLKNCKSEEEALEVYMTYGETLLRTLEKADDVLWAISVRNALNKLGKKFNNKDAINMGSKLDKAINEKWPEKEVKNAVNTLEKADNAIKKKSEAEAKGAENDESSKDDNKQKIENEVTQVFKEEKDILGPLAKEAGLDGQSLLGYIKDKLNKLTTDNPETKEKVKKYDPKAKDFDQEKFDKLVLGMCITICGAIITEDDDVFNEITNLLNVNNLEIKKLKQNVIKKKNRADKAAAKNNA